MNDMDFATARFNMVEQQIRPWDVIHPGVLQVMGELARENFVPEGYRQLAYADTEIPLPNGRRMMFPRLEARALQALDVQADETVLEVGTGTGFFTACLATFARQVTSIDPDAALIEMARRNLEAQAVTNVRTHQQDIFQEWAESQKYNAIAVTGSVSTIPAELEQALAIGGRLFVVVGEGPVMSAMLITRTDESNFQRVALFETEMARLPGAPEPQKFVF